MNRFMDELCSYVDNKSKKWSKVSSKSERGVSVLPGPSGRPCRASLCGTAWAEVPGLCVQRDVSARNCTYAAFSTNAGLQISPSYPHLPSTQTSIPLDLSLHGCLHFTPPFFFLFFFRLSVSVCSWLAMPSVPSAAKPTQPSTPQLSPTLPTCHKGGLNHLCASVFPQWKKGESLRSGRW